MLTDQKLYAPGHTATFEGNFISYTQLLYFHLDLSPHAANCKAKETWHKLVSDFQLTEWKYSCTAISTNDRGEPVIGSLNSQFTHGHPAYKKDIADKPTDTRYSDIYLPDLPTFTHSLAHGGTYLVREN